jgi:hypothetical protein
VLIMWSDRHFGINICSESTSLWAFRTMENTSHQSSGVIAAVSQLHWDLEIRFYFRTMENTSLVLCLQCFLVSGSIVGSNEYLLGSVKILFHLVLTFCHTEHMFNIIQNTFSHLKRLIPK